MTVTLAGYQTTDLIYDGTRTQVYRGFKTDDSKPVVIKKLRKEYPTFNELVQFRHQYVLSKNLELPGIVRPIALEKYGNGYVLVMEDVGGVSLSEYISDRPLELKEFLRIAIAIAKILEDLYRNRIIHKDIKPANILINPETKQIYLIDFSISSVLPRETKEIQNPNVLEGTLAYISPEQTGRMNRGIDYRSDFYSLGMTFYKLLTGEVPFKSDDPIELVHCHIAKTPAPPHEVKPEIPLGLSDLVMKLMAKTAEERYQSALGIKYDLEKCRQQWQETGSIAEFELGERDKSDRFIIPEKLYGRETEVQALLDAFDRVAAGTTELMLVAGFSGIGKTAVVSEVHKPIARQRGYFILGKFDQFQRNVPFSALVIAFRNLMGQLSSESDAELEAWKTTILDALGENAGVIIEVIPELEQIIGLQPPPAQLSGSAAQNRFNLLFQKFISVFSTREHPLVIFVDDLQWADSASLKLIELLMGDSNMGYLLLLGAYRDNEVFPAHPLMLSLDEIASGGATLNTITLSPLSQGNLNRLVADTLCCSLELGLPLTELVYQKTEGNPFFATQFLKSLHQDGWIEFNLDLGHWQCDMARVRQLALTSDVVEFMASRLHKLPENTRELLKLAACIGNQFNLQALAVASEKSVLEVAESLWVALQEGLVLPESDNYKFFQGANREENMSGDRVSVGYQFLHDRVQQAAYSLIPEERKQQTHLKIGRLLLKNTPEAQREEKIFKIVNQLNVGRQLILEGTEREELARLNLRAGRKAKASTAYSGAVEYLKTGIELLAADSWESEYNLTLAIYTEIIESSFLNAEFEQADNYSEYVLDRVSNIADAVKIYELTIDRKIAEQKSGEALEIGLQILNELGISMESILDYGKREIVLPTIESLANAPQMKDSNKLASMQLLVSITSAATTSKPELLFPIIVTQVHLSLEEGNSNLTAFSYSWYGSLLCGYFGEIDKGYRAGLLAMELLEQFETTSLKCQVLTMVYQFVYPWKNHLRQLFSRCLDAFKIGRENGDLIYASYNISNYWLSLFFSGDNLDRIFLEVTPYINYFREKRIKNTASIMDIWKQLNLNLQGLAEDSYKLIGEAANEAVLATQMQKADDYWGLFSLHVAKEILLYFLGDYPKSAAESMEAKKFLSAVGGWVPIVAHYLYDSLSLLALYGGADKMEREQYLERVETNQEKMLVWAVTAPMNFQHKYDLVEAERHRALGNQTEAIELYDKAIAGAKANEYTQEEALANELAAKFYLDWGKEKVASGYMQEAYYCYARWGAKAKIDDLEKRYPTLLTPILERQKLALSPNASIATLIKGTVSHTSTGTAEILDLATLMKASRTLSEEIELEGAIANLMQVARENAGAETAALMLFQEEVLILTALVAGEGGQKIDPIPVENSKLVPASIVNKVKRSGKPLVLDNASNENAFAGDAYIRSSQPKSILCLPLMDRGKLIGILYLENNRVARAFTSDRVELLNLLCAQAAISLENARLYESSQEYAQKLERTLLDLQSAQVQLVQSEKMSALGNLVSGVGHEMNNPLGFISATLQQTKPAVTDVIEYLKLYEETFPNKSSEIVDRAEEIDLDYTLEDLPKMVDSMGMACDRLKHISTSLRTFSRSDRDYKVPFNLHDGIDSTLLILKHRLKANDKRPEIKVVKNYGSLPEVNCYPGQLNQVFMNLLANALDALEEWNKGETRITITTEIDEEKERAMVRIKDNGPGISEEVKQKIFDHLFTTKEVGKGTGLGLSISRQIVVEKHGGTINCTSEVGEGTEFAIALPLRD